MPSNEIWTIVGSLISIVALLLSIVFFEKSKKKRLLLYMISPTPLITEEMTKYPGLEIFFHGQPVETLTSTKILFSNAGNQLLEPNDFASKQPLTLNVSGQFFLDESGVNADADNPNSTPSIELIDDQTAKIIFDFLDPKCAFQLTLLHTGEVTVSGDLKNGRIDNHLFRRKQSLKRSIALSLFDCIAGMGIFLFSILAKLGLIFILLGIFIVVVSAILLYRVIRELTKLNQ